MLHIGLFLEYFTQSKKLCETTRRSFGGFTQIIMKAIIFPLVVKRLTPSSHQAYQE